MTMLMVALVRELELIPVSVTVTARHAEMAAEVRARVLIESPDELVLLTRAHL